MSKRALILGVGGQDGSYMADLLLAKGYEVWGLYRKSSVDNLQRIRHLLEPEPRIKLVRGDVTDAWGLISVIQDANPDEVYHLADQDKPDWSTAAPTYQVSVGVASVVNALEAVSKIRASQRQWHGGEKTRMFYPLSATMFGDAPAPQNEETPLRPQSVYACAKAAAWHLCRHYREQHRVWVACGIMFNHDSPRRGPDYLLQKICRQAWEIKQGKRGGFDIPGDLGTRVDIGYAPEYMEAAWRIMQLERPDDFCVGTRIARSIWELIAMSASYLGLSSFPLPPKPEGEPEKYLRADASKVARQTGWGASGPFATISIILDSLQGQGEGK